MRGPTEADHDMFLVLSRGRAVWGWQHGIKWLPAQSRLARVLCAGWNLGACRVLGHLWLCCDVPCRERESCRYCAAERAAEPVHACLAEALVAVGWPIVDAGR